MAEDVVPLEEVEQIRFSVWLKKRGIRHTASANGAKRTVNAGKKLLAMGMSPGFPDIEVPYPIKHRTGMYVYCGLYIEMKRSKGGKLSEEQADWLEFLRSQGYYADCAHGCAEAIEIFNHYISLGNNPIAA